MNFNFRDDLVDKKGTIPQVRRNLNKAPRLSKLRMRKLERKEKKRDTKDNETGEKNETTALLHLELISHRPQKAKEKTM